MKTLKITKTKMREAEKNLSRHIISLNVHFVQIEELYLELRRKKNGKREQSLANELVAIKLHVKELKQIVLDFEEF